MYKHNTNDYMGEGLFYIKTNQFFLFNELMSPRYCLSISSIKSEYIVLPN